MDEKQFRDAYDIFCEVFNSSVSYETFRHKHLDNPDLIREIATLVDYQDGVPAGTNSFMRCILLCGGKRVTAVLSNDTAVKARFRGRHIFTSLIEQEIEKCRETHAADVMFGFPNKNSYPGFLKMGFHEVGALYSYAAVVRPVSFLKRTISGKMSYFPGYEEDVFTADGYTWQVSLACPFSEDDLSVINGRGRVQIQHSRAFFDWKLGGFPKGSKCYICVREGTKLCAFFVLINENGGKCAVCDWMLPDSRKTARRILHHALCYLKKYGDIVVVQCVNPANREAGILWQAGMLIRKRVTPVLYYPITDKIDGETMACLNDFSGWSLRSIDGDTILLK